MSLLTALYTGSSGITANTEDLSVIGDNIANTNTIGFKMSRADFEEQLSESLLGAGGIGLGTNVDRVQQILTQGSLTQTGNATDLALEGNGMFVVKGSENGVTGNFYTRDGEFSVNKDGYLTTQDGLRVQGFSADATGGIESALGDLNLGDQTAPPLATANISLVANLDSTAVAPTVQPFDPANASATSNFNTSTTIYDSLGNATQATVYFTKTADNQWDWNAVTDGAKVQGGTAGTPSVIANGSLTFNTAGALTAETQTSNFNPIAATEPQALNFNFGSVLGTGTGTGIDGVTQFAGQAGNGQQSSATAVSQDGYTSGSLSSIAIGSDGAIEGTFSNGSERAVGQVAVASFQAPDRLQRMGGNLYMATPNNDVNSGVLGDASGGEGVDDSLQTPTGSGDATIGVAGTGGRGSITSGSLEQSNVDITNQFVDMIAAQRDFEANSKTVTTADTMLSDLIQMKR